MLRVRDIMTADVLALNPATSVREAMELLSRRHVSGAPVIAGEKVVGVVTANDLMTFASSLSGVPTQRDTSDACDLEDVSSIVGDGDEGDGDPVAVFFTDMWDDAGADVVERQMSLAGPEWNALEEHDVSEAMTAGGICDVAPDTDARSAAELMTERGIHRLLVTDGGRLVGIVSALDIARAVAQHRLVERTYVFNDDRLFVW